MGDFDEYAYLEKQLEKRETGGAKENGHRSSSRHGSDRERDRDRDRDRDRTRDKDKDRDRKSRDGDRDRDGRNRVRSRSRDRRKSRDRDKDSDRKSSRRSRSRDKRRERTPPEVREQRERERELMELDRDIRTVFAYNLNLRADEKDIFKFFSKAGTVVDVRIICDRNTRKSKGFAYIEMEKRAEKNLAWEAAQQSNAAMQQMNALAASMGAAGTGPCKLSISNLHPNIQEADLKQIFEPFGLVDGIQLFRDAAGRSQGYAFVQYQSMTDATKAMQQLDSMDIAGSKISLKIAAIAPTDPMTMMTANLDLDDEDEQGGLRLTSNARAALMSRLAGGSASGVAGVPGVVPGGTGANMLPLGGGLPGAPGLPGYVAPAQPAGPVLSAAAQALQLEQGVLGPSSPIPTPCLLIKNMFDPATETEPDWELDIAADVKDEAGKYGPVLHIFIDKNSKGFVYLKFASTEAASAAQKAFHGRWFAGRQLVVNYEFAQPYSAYFRC